MNWQPIETAPKDGTEVLIYGNRRWAVASCQYGHWSDMGDIGWAGSDEEPTHWMPLPPPPTQEPQS